ncbi:MAG TPA: MBL fold metallo-hydrolase [Myxococcota bacterium]|jgi:glyoxylase-like metal-dependent hydrolase (beta-lactamase superfamily II)
MTTTPRFAYRKGLHDLGNGCFAWLQPDGGWGWSNAGLVTDAGASLLVDTLFDLALTREMLAAMRSATPAAVRIGALVNTHANGDHCYGNSLLRGCEIIASRATAEEMAEVPPALMQRLIESAEQLGPAGAFFRRVFGAFDFRGIEPALPTRTFQGELALTVGGKRVNLLEVGPAHTRGDVLVHSPEDRIVFTGDILFIDGTPIVWEGPVANWIRACQAIEAMDVDVVVPGHGPITDRGGARRVREYLAFVHEEARLRFDAGLSARDAAHDIDLGAWADWRDPERIAVNVDTVYRELRGGGERANPLELFGRMAELARS